MKQLLLLVLLCSYTLAFTQQKSSFLKKHLYIKAAPTLLCTSDVSDNLRINGSLAPAIFGALGAKTRYAALGFSAGYFNLKGEGGKSVTPLGIDLTITDFKRKKAFPVLTAQWHKIHYKDDYYIGKNASHRYEISGKEMLSIGAGVAFRAFNENKLMITLGYSRINCDARHGNRNPNPSPGDPNLFTYSNIKDHIGMASLALAWLF